MENDDTHSEDLQTCDVCGCEAWPALAIAIVRVGKEDLLLTVCSCCESEYDPDDWVECANCLLHVPRSTAAWAHYSRDAGEWFCFRCYM